MSGPTGADRWHPADPDPPPPGTVTCPHCGHQLSMFMELESDRAEAAAARIAGAAGSWWFLVMILLLIAGWFGVNAVFQPFQPHPSTMIGYLGTMLTAVAALQGPLILLVQRRETARDRAREIESFHVATNVEADLHAIRTALGTAKVLPSPDEPGTRPGPG